MTQRIRNEPGIENGLNSEVECDGQRYHVQTQCSTRGAPVIESLAFQGGQTLVRITASYKDVARRLGFNGDDGRHLLELQHADLVRKIRHGMLRDDESPEVPADDSPYVMDSSGELIDPEEIDDPGVRELLHELGLKVDAARAAALPTEPVLPLPAVPWWRRVAVSIRLPF